jgi:hypothetical protein
MPAFVNAGTWSDSSGATALTPALPTGRSLGNLLIAVVGSKNNFVHTSTSNGWTKYDQRNSGTGWTVSLWVYKRYSGGVDGSEAAPTIAVGSSSVACFAQVIQFSGPFDVQDILAGAMNVNTGTTSTHTCTGITTTADNSLAIYIDAAAADTALGTPSGWIEDLDNGSSTSATQNANGSKAITSVGTSSGNISVTGASAAWVMWQIELRSQSAQHAWVTSKFETDASQASYSFPSRTPDSAKAQLIAVMWFGNGGTVSLSGCNLTWTKVEEIQVTNGTQHAIALFVGTGTPTTGVVNVSFSTAPSRCVGIALEIPNVDTGNPILQYASAQNDNATSLVVTLSSAPTGKVLGFFNCKWTPHEGTGFNLVHGLQAGNSWDKMRALVEESMADQTVDATCDLGPGAGIGCELRPSSAPQGQPRWARGYGIPTDAGWRRSSWN